MFKNCIVPNCKADAKSSMHQFPKNPCIGEEWLIAIRNPVLRNLPYHIIRKKRLTICNEHFEKNAWIPTFSGRRLKPNAVPALQLPDSESSEVIYHNRKKDLDQIDILINDEETEDKTVITNIFSFNDFSSSFSYSDSPTFVNIKDLPIRKRDICENFESEIPSLRKCEERPQLVFKHKNSFDISEFIKVAQLNDIQKRESCSKTLSKPRLNFIQESNPDILELQNDDSNISEVINRPQSDSEQENEPDFSENMLRPQLDCIDRSSLDVSKRRKRPRLQLQNGDSDIAQGPAEIRIERVQDNAGNEKENATNVAAFEVVECDSPVEENSSILRNIFFNKEVNKTTNLGGEKKKEEQNQLFIGKAKHIELPNVRHEVYNTAKNVKRQKYRTTIRLKRQSNENGTVQEDVFVIEHTFISACNACPNHENDRVSCSVVKAE